jgi:2-keto-4-pentenoate hydratase/2-oxohepta-3-ene-1,7-dioic acid hydratase in catechol pathway
VRIANLDGRVTLLTKRGAVDIETTSDGLFSSDVNDAFARWSDVVDWAATIDDDLGDPFDESRLRAPSPRPRQVFAVGLNYAPHAAEAGLAKPTAPLVFTKFPSCIVGPHADVPLPSGIVDWEVELVAVIGRTASHVPAARAWSYVAGLTVGQDFSEREVQARGPAPQFSLGKSFPSFGPTGPWLVTIDEFADPDDLGIECLVDAEVVQRGRTSDLLFPIPELIAYISAICPLLPGDLVFTGTPDGTGAGRSPQRFLRPGEVVMSRIEGIGTMRNECVAQLNAV